MKRLSFAVSLVISSALILATAASSQNLTLTSDAFAAGGTIAPEYTCQGAGGHKNLSPTLRWTGAPPGVKAFAMTVKDPDAPRGTFVHWVIFNIPSSADSLRSGEPRTPTLANGARQGVNSLGNIGYLGPCPPPGPAHHYHFDLTALDASLKLPAGASAADLEAASAGHVIGSAELIGTFAR